MTPTLVSLFNLIKLNILVYSYLTLSLFLFFYVFFLLSPLNTESTHNKNGMYPVANTPSKLIWVAPF